MTIETLQALKDAGFPQQREGKTIVRTGAGSPLYVPTMKELIESLGDLKITLSPQFYESRLPGANSTVEEWTACTEWSCAVGKDRDEALANLYIHIKNK